MTPDCIKRLEYLEDQATTISEADISSDGVFTFIDLSVEQLLYAAIKATSIEEVRAVLEVTDWDYWIRQRIVN